MFYSYHHIFERTCSAEEFIFWHQILLYWLSLQSDVTGLDGYSYSSHIEIICKQSAQKIQMEITNSMMPYEKVPLQLAYQFEQFTYNVLSSAELYKVILPYIYTMIPLHFPFCVSHVCAPGTATCPQHNIQSSKLHIHILSVAITDTRLKLRLHDMKPSWSSFTWPPKYQLAAHNVRSVKWVENHETSYVLNQIFKK